MIYSFLKQVLAVSGTRERADAQNFGWTCRDTGADNSAPVSVECLCDHAVAVRVLRTTRLERRVRPEARAPALDRPDQVARRAVADRLHGVIDQVRRWPKTPVREKGLRNPGPLQRTVGDRFIVITGEHRETGEQASGQVGIYSIVQLRCFRYAKSRECAKA